MKLNFTPMRRNDMLNVNVAGDVLTINGEAFDLSGIPDGATLPRADVACDWLASDIERIGGTIHLTLILPHGENAPHETLFPQPITVTADGPVELPPYAATQSDAEKDEMLLDMLVHVPDGVIDPITGGYK